MSETANLNVDSETGSLKSMGSGVDSISCLRMSFIGEMACNGSGEPPGAAPTCSKLWETVNSEVNTSISGMGNFDSMGSCSGMSSVGATTSSGKGDPPCAAPSGYTGSELGETANLKANTFASFGESPTNVAPRVFSSGRSSLRVVVPTGSTLGLWVLVVDAAPCDVCLGYVRKFAGYSDSGR